MISINLRFRFNFLETFSKRILIGNLFFFVKRLLLLNQTKIDNKKKERSASLHNFKAIQVFGAIYSEQVLHIWRINRFSYSRAPSSSSKLS